MGKTTSVAALSNAVNGLCEEILMLLHPKIMSAGRVQDMFRQLLNIYSKNNVKADPDNMAYISSFECRYRTWTSVHSSTMKITQFTTSVSVTDAPKSH